MQMTDIEIVGRFRRAENKKGQVQILADLNACSKEEIVEVLKKYDIDVSGYIKKKGRKPKTESTEEVVVKEEDKVECSEDKEVVVPVALIPRVVVTVCEEKIARLTEDIENCFERIKEMEEERDALCDYLGRTG